MTPKNVSRCISLIEAIPGYGEMAKEAYRIVLEDMDDQVGMEVVSRCLKTLERRPAPAKLLSMAQESRWKVPSADEAWSLCPRSEEETVIWTGEIARAYYAATPLLFPEEGKPDPVAARMAFKEAYTREEGERREKSRPPVWSLSRGAVMRGGEDARSRIEATRNAVIGAIDTAIARGWLTRGDAHRLLPAAPAEPRLAIEAKPEGVPCPPEAKQQIKSFSGKEWPA